MKKKRFIRITGTLCGVFAGISSIIGGVLVMLNPTILWVEAEKFLILGIILFLLRKELKSKSE